MEIKKPGPDPEVEALRQQLAAIQSRVETLAARRSSAEAGAAPPPPAAANPPEDAAPDEWEEADVDRVAPKPGETVNTNRGRVPAVSLGPRGRDFSALGFEVAMYLTRLLHRGVQAGSKTTISESFSAGGDRDDQPLSVAGDAGLLAIQTATEGLPPRLHVHAEPFPRRDDPQDSGKFMAELLEPLASAPRLDILAYLRAGSRTSTELQEGLGFAPGQLYHHLRPLAAAGFLRKADDGRYAISGPGRKALVAIKLLSTQIYSDRHWEQFERDREGTGDTRYQRFAVERSTEVPLSEDAGPPAVAGS